jgi:protease-4
MNEPGDDWEKSVLSNLAAAGLQEQKRARRWGIFFKLLTFTYLTIVLVAYINPEVSKSSSSDHTALVELNGEIADGKAASADNIIDALDNAFKNKHSVGVILRINSPGGSPVQAGQIYDEIKRLRKKYPDKHLYAVVTDVCASGGYYVASAADKIYADKASIVGSIGVRMDNFGFVGAMKKFGIEQRTLTAGKNKALLDPFAPVNKEARAQLQSMLDDIHQQFINAVKAGRGSRLKLDTKDLFSGLIWTGEQAKAIGLVDDLASTDYVARKIIGNDTIVDYTLHEDLFDRLAGRVGASIALTLDKNLGILQLH